jgi:hypothetical protein
MAICIAVKASIRCPDCSNYLPLNGLHTHASCPQCHSAFDVDGDRLWWLDDDCLEQLVCAAAAAEPAEKIEFDDWQDVANLTTMRREATCAGCEAILATARILEARDANKPCVCPACSKAWPVRAPEDGWRERMPWLSAVAGEAPAAVMAHRGQTVAVTCPNCGAPLSPAAGQATIRCGYCGTTSELPEQGSARRRDWFYLVLEADEKTRLRWRLLNTDPDELKKMASSPETSAAALAILAGFDWRYTPAVAENPNTPEHVLVGLSKNEEWRARENVAKHPRAPIEALLRLASDEKGSVREAVAARSSLPPEVLAKLLDERRDDGVFSILIGNRALLSRPDLSEQTLRKLAAGKDTSAKVAVARAEAATPALLTELAASKDGDVRAAVAGNAKTPVETLARLGRDEDFGVLRAVARHAATPAEVLSELAMHFHKPIAAEAQRNPACPPLSWWQKARIHFRGT